MRGVGPVRETGAVIGHWTFAEVPAGDWVRDALGLARDPRLADPGAAPR